jgi:PKD repeat protein
MKRLIIGLILVVCLLAPAACAPAGAPPPSEGEEMPPAMPKEEAPPPAPEIPAAPEAFAVSEEELGQPWATERMIVRTGDVSLIVEDVPEAMNQITGLAASFGGYVVSSKRWGEGERLAGAIAIRVPAEYFDDAMKALRELAVDVSSENTYSKDVTEEYVDLRARLQNLEASEAQLLKLMEKAEKVEDILAVQRELSKTRGEIEQTKGRMQYLERTSATSLIEIRLEQAKLDVKFTADKGRVKEGEEVHFSPEIAGGFAPYSYEWDFGDGNTSTDKAPTHSYKAAGSYTVSLQVTDDRGNTDTETRGEYITVLTGWRAGSVVTGARNALVGFGHVLVTVAIWLGIFSPVWLVIGGILYWRYRRRKKRASLTTSPNEPKERKE